MNSVPSPLATAALSGEALTYVAGDPYPWPYNGKLRPDNTAL